MSLASEPEAPNSIFEAGTGDSSLSFSESSMTPSWDLPPNTWVKESFFMALAAASAISSLP